MANLVASPSVLTPVPSEYTIATLSNLATELRRIGVDSITVEQLDRLVEYQNRYVK